MSAAYSRYRRYEKSSRTLVEKFGDKTPFERPCQSYEIILKLVGPRIYTACEGLDWIDLIRIEVRDGILCKQGIS
jgi:hypothetical protein